MNFLDIMKRAGQVTDVQLQNITNALVIALWADGQPTQAEFDAFAKRLDGTPWFEGRSQEQVNEILTAAHKVLEDLVKQQSQPAILDALRTMGQHIGSMEMRESVLRVAMDLALLDRNVSEEEMSTLNAMAQCFDITEERGTQIAREQVAKVQQS